ncbi:MAG: Fe-S protein assembly co-chaperone HscB [Sphingobacteriales bacterium]|nr:Fe-S protein assembly co-chaperone HscB [Sphingobacteriales bacterium]MBI3717718.1 Fe-S protein assembly co-chaperone HscB [Sphingobacteriales bacterium]
MNYFELFELPVSLKVDVSAIAKKYFELQKKYHPDYYSNASEEVQADVLEKAAHINKAFKTFKNPDETIKYVLMQKRLLEEEEKYQLPPGFLMEMMDLNEQLAEAAFDGDDNLAAVKMSMENAEKEIYSPVQSIIENYKEGETTETDLLKVKEYYYKKKYLNRLKEQVK